MPYVTTTTIHHRRTDLVVGLQSEVKRWETQGKFFDPTYLPNAIAADANTGEKWLRVGVMLAWDSVNSRIVLYDHENASPTYPFIGVNDHEYDIRNGGLPLNPISGGTLNPDLLWCVNTGGSPATLSGSACQTIINALIQEVSWLRDLKFE